MSEKDFGEVCERAISGINEAAKHAQGNDFSEIDDNALEYAVDTIAWLRDEFSVYRAQEQNEPLTLEQVELLNEKPIFVVFIDCEGDTYKQWFLVDTDGTNTTLRGTDYNLYVRKGGTADMYHITAYTYEPKGADRESEAIGRN